MKEYIVNNIDETNKVAEDLVSKLKGKSVIALSGNLGAGKTTFVKAIANKLGVEENVTSPTFVLIKLYNTKDEKIKKIIHVDCYRLDGKEDLYEIGLEDYLEYEDSLVVIEWADKIVNLPDDIIKINIKIIGENKRNIKIE